MTHFIPFGTNQPFLLLEMIKFYMFLHTSAINPLTFLSICLYDKATDSHVKAVTQRRNLVAYGKTFFDSYGNSKQILNFFLVKNSQYVYGNLPKIIFVKVGCIIINRCEIVERESVDSENLFPWREKVLPDLSLELTALQERLVSGEFPDFPPYHGDAIEFILALAEAEFSFLDISNDLDFLGPWAEETLFKVETSGIWTSGEKVESPLGFDPSSDSEAFVADLVE